jgi:hypothetical protein
MCIPQGSGRNPENAPRLPELHSRQSQNGKLIVETIKYATANAAAKALCRSQE